jgi:hypothetical protein
MKTSSNTLKKHLVRGVFMGMFAILLFRAGGADATALTQNTSMKSDVPDHRHFIGAYVLNAVAAVSSSDVWAVGYLNDGTLIEHWDGTQWSIVPSPNGGTYSELFAVSVVSATNIWAVGRVASSYPTYTLIEHWDGTQWSIVPSPQESDGGLYGITALSSTDIWAVGYQNNDQTLIEHWDGSQWSIVSSPNPPQWSVVPSGKIKFAAYFFGVVAISTTDVWAVGFFDYKAKGEKGQKSLTEHWDGTKWVIVPSP